VDDLDAVVGAADVERFALLGISQGASIAVTYAARHPERVTHLVLYGGYARGRLRRGAGPREVEEAEMMNRLAEIGWGQENPAFRQFFTSQFIVDEVRAFLPAGRSTGGTFAGLTPRERELVELIAQGRDNAQIAASLGLSEKTVRNHITSIFAKLQVENRAQAIVLAHQRLRRRLNADA
jgi:DNA-binding CsgD family transcriptional regulator